MLTAWNWVAFQGSSVLGSEVTPTTRFPPGVPAPPVAPAVDVDEGVPEQATKAREAVAAMAP